MIKRVVVKFRKIGVWARGETYDVAPNVPHIDGEILFDKSYPSGTPTSKVWSDLKSSMIGYFFDTFYPAVVWQTLPPKPRTTRSNVALRRQTEHVREKQSKLPTKYVWNPRMNKWHMSAFGYEDQTRTLGGPMKISVAETPYEDMYDYSLLDDLQDRFAGKKKTIILFIYPDRYDQEVRAMFEIDVWFW